MRKVGRSKAFSQRIDALRGKILQFSHAQRTEVRKGNKVQLCVASGSTGKSQDQCVGVCTYSCLPFSVMAFLD